MRSYAGHFASPMNTVVHAGFFLLALFLALVLSPSFAFAYNPNTDLGLGLCRAAGLVGGGLGRGLATAAVITLGVGATMGKVTWTMAVMSSVGIAAMFGGPAIAAIIVGQTC